MYRLNKIAAVIPRIIISDVALTDNVGTYAWYNALTKIVATATAHPAVVEVGLRYDCVTVLLITRHVCHIAHMPPNKQHCLGR